MTDVQYAPQASQLRDVAGERIPRPRRVSQALSLLWISGGLDFVGTGLLLSSAAAEYYRPAPALYSA